MTLTNTDNPASVQKRFRRKAQGRSASGLLKSGFGLLTRRERSRAAGVLLLMLAGSLIEAFVISAVMPLIWLIVEPSTLAGNPNVEWFLKLVSVAEVGELVPFLGIATCALIAVGVVFALLSQALILRFAAACRTRLGRELMSKLVAAPYPWLARKNGAVMTRQLYADISSWSIAFVQSTLQIVQNVLLILLPAAIVIWMSPLFGVAALALVGALSVALVGVARPRIQRYSEAAKNAANRVVQTAVRIFGAAKDVRVSGRQDFFVNQFDRFNTKLNEVGWRNKMWAAAPAIIIIGFGQLALLGIAIGMWWRGFSSGEIAAQMALIVVVTSRVLPAVNRLMTQLTVFWGSLPYVEGIIELSDSLDDAIDSTRPSHGGDPLNRTWRSLTLENVSFRYPTADQASLVNCTLRFERGRSYGIVGPSGAGKSTLLDVILGLLEPDSGSVLLDDHPFAAIDLSDWHQQVSYVPQFPFFLDDSLRRNVAFGRADGDIDEERVCQALNRANFEKVLATLPDGLSSVLGERGVGLSGGQLQRVAIARALYQDSSLLLLDEATSALDLASEADVQESVAHLDSDLLTISVAHRVASLRNCDEIVVMQDGGVAARGDYETLMQTCDLFRTLARSSTDPVSLAEAPGAMTEPWTR